MSNDLPIRRNTALLSAALAANSGMLQLQAAVASLTLALVLDVRGLLGLGPAIVLGSGAMTAMIAGRAMDRRGRVPVLAVGFTIGLVGCGLAAAGSATEVAPLVVLGMYALVLVVGDLIDRVGRAPALSGGLVVMALSAVSLIWVQSVPATAVVLFGLGLGWNLSFVAATAELADRTHPSERGRLLGFNDMLSGMTGATLALVGGVTLTEAGVASLAVGAAVLVVAPALWIWRLPAVAT